MLDRKIGATRCQILGMKCIKFDFGWGFAVFNGPTSNGRERKVKEGEGGENDLMHRCHKFLATPLV